MARQILSARPEGIVLQHALNEATVGLFLLTSGLYRPAYLSLRLFLELSLACVYFSANRLELAEWMNGTNDIRWATLTHEESGILSARYANAFFPELRDSVRLYAAIANKLYRELSEFVHGNHHTWGTTDQIVFDLTLQSRWLQNFQEAVTVVHYALCLRFMKELVPSEMAKVSGVVIDSLGHVAEIREVCSR